jgi:hypothetical protein
VTAPFDPLGWLGRRTVGLPRSVAGVLDQWVQATTWWADVAGLSRLTDAPAATLDRLLVELAEGVAARYDGGAVELRRGDLRIDLALDSLRLEGHGTSAVPVLRSSRSDAVDLGARVEARDVVIRADVVGPVQPLLVRPAPVQPVRLERVALHAVTLQLEPELPPRLVARDIELRVDTDVSGLLGWARTQVPDWRLEVDEDGLILAHHDRHDVFLLLEPVLQGAALRLEIRRAGRGRRSVPIPRLLRLDREIVLHPPDGLTVESASRRGRQVTALLRVDEFSQTIDLGAVRAAVVAGRPLLFAPE